MLGARSLKEQDLGRRVHGRIFEIEQGIANLIPNRGAPRLTRHHYLKPRLAEGFRQWGHM